MTSSATLGHAATVATFIAELTTAISFAGAATLYAYNTWWLPGQTDVSAYIVQSTAETFSVYVANEGGTDVVVRSLGIKSEGLDGMVFKAKLPSGGQMVEHGKSALVASAPSHLNSAVKVDPDLVPKQPPGTHISTTKCSAQLQYVDSKGRTGKMALPFDCYAASIIPQEE